MCRQFLLRSKLGDLEWGNRREQNREEGKGSPGVHLGAGYHCGQAGQYPRGSFWGTVAKTWERGVLPMGLCLCWSKCALGSADSGTPAGLCMCACAPVWTCTCVSTAGLLPAGGGGGRRWGGRGPGAERRGKEAQVRKAAPGCNGAQVLLQSQLEEQVTWVHVSQGPKPVRHKGNVISGGGSHYFIRLAPMAECRHPILIKLLLSFLLGCRDAPSGSS